MMSGSGRRAFTITLFLVTAASLAGCGGGGGGGADESGSVEIVIWEQRDPQERAVMDSVLADYDRAHPNVTFSVVHYDTENLRNQYQTAALAGGGPDIAYGPSDQVGPFSELQIIKPLDESLVLDLVNRHQLLVTIEENVVMGGAGSAVNEYLLREGHSVRVLNLGLPDDYQHHASQQEQLVEVGLDVEGILQSIHRATRAAALQVVEDAS